MSGHITGTRHLWGQVVFADLDAGTLTLDCVLGRAGDASGAPVTFSAWFPPLSTSPDEALELLREWADDAAPIVVTITDGHDGPHVQIASDSGQIVLEPEPNN